MARLSLVSAVHKMPSSSRSRLSGWSFFAGFICLLCCIPLVSVAILALFPSENIWPHLISTVLPRYTLTTILLMLGVITGTSLIGTATAWMVTHYDFPCRTGFTWALLLPFAMPAYVLAYVYTDLLEYAGPVQTMLRGWFGWTTPRDYYFPAIRSLGGAIIVMALVLYPYVYLLARAAFLEQSASVLEVARVLGRSRSASFFRIALPMARPAIVIGVAMALMETLNDFGTVSHFAVQTLTLGIYDVWLGMSNLGGGAQIAMLLLTVVLLLLAIEKTSRRARQTLQPAGSRMRPLQRSRLRSGKALAATTLCALPIVLGFVVPVAVLLRYAVLYFDVSWTEEFRLAAWHSVSLSAGAAIAAVSIGIILSYSLRLSQDRLLGKLTSLATIGYAIPGIVLAIGIMIPFGLLDNTIDAFFRHHFQFSTGLLLSGTVFALLFAYTVRFLAVAFGAVDTSLKKISPSMDEAARSLGHTPTRILTRIHIPLMKSGLLTGILVVFVDCMKELPATLVMRPFNYDTLATQVYQFASDELIERSALGSLLIVLVGLLPVIVLSLTIDRSRSQR